MTLQILNSTVKTTPRATSAEFTKTEDFTQGMKLEYDGMLGHVNFIGQEYITLTLCNPNKTDRTRDVNLLVHPWNWNKLKIVPVLELVEHP